MIIDVVCDQRGTSIVEAYEKWLSQAEGKVCCDFSLQVALTWWGDQVYKEMEILTQEKGVNAFKVFMNYKDMFMLTDSEMFAVFKRCKELGALPLADECEAGEYEADEYEADEYEADEYEADEYEADEDEADEYEADEYGPWRPT
ncbi:hypothetical protein ACOMHN_066711 [Nucella lapillus]